MIHKLHDIVHLINKIAIEHAKQAISHSKIRKWEKEMKDIIDKLVVDNGQRRD